MAEIPFVGIQMAGDAWASDENADCWMEWSPTLGYTSVSPDSVDGGDGRGIWDFVPRAIFGATSGDYHGEIHLTPSFDT